MRFPNKVYNKELSFDKVKEILEKMMKKIKELDKRTKPSRGAKPTKRHKQKEMEIVIKNAEDLYNFREKIINEIKESEKGETEETEEIEETEESEESEDDTDFSWLHGSKNESRKLWNDAIDIKKVFNLRKDGKFIKKINPVNLQIFLKDALEKYVKKN